MNKIKNKLPSYNEAYREIEEILSRIENGEPDVDELTALVKRASSLIKLCRNKLKNTEVEIKKILDEEDNS